MKKLLICIFAVFVGLILATPVLAFPSLVPEECAGEAKLPSPVGGAPVETCMVKDNKQCDDLKKNGQCLVCCVDCEPTQSSNRENCCCNLGSVERVAVNIANIILGVTGALVLLMFVIGGAMLVFSGGSPERVKKATGIMRTTVIGLAIIILAGVLIRVGLSTLTGVKDGGPITGDPQAQEGINPGTLPGPEPGSLPETP